MTEFTKKLFTFGGSLAIVVPAEVCELLRLQKGDFVTVSITDIHDKDEVVR